MKKEKRLEELADLIEAGHGDINALIAEQNRLHTEFEDEGGLTYKSRTRSALTGLGFSESDFSLPCSLLSGGQRSKLALGKLLLSAPDLLLLDEPTNHIDLTSLEWLESFINDYRGSAVIISHDRYFLDKVTTKTMLLEGSRCSTAAIPAFSSRRPNVTRSNAVTTSDRWTKFTASRA